MTPEQKFAHCKPFFGKADRHPSFEWCPNRIMEARVASIYFGGVLLRDRVCHDCSFWEKTIYPFGWKAAGCGAD